MSGLDGSRSQQPPTTLKIRIMMSLGLDNFDICSLGLGLDIETEVIKVWVSKLQPWSHFSLV